MIATDYSTSVDYRMWRNT